MPNPSDKLSENKDLGVAVSSHGRSGGPSDPSPQAVSAVPAPAANATPGPWTARRYVGRKENWFVRGPNDERVCGQGAGRVTEANARLIAAAPDLHRALVRARDVINALYVTIGMTEDGRAQNLAFIDAAFSRLTPSKE